jgi:hypothetical protein
MEQRCAERDGAAPRSALLGALPYAAEAQPFLAVVQLARDVERAAGPVAQAFINARRRAMSIPRPGPRRT